MSSGISFLFERLELTELLFIMAHYGIMSII